jgi:general secretion pathway protein E
VIGKPGADKADQAKVVMPMMKAEVSSSQPGNRQGVTGKPPSVASAGLPPGKPGAEKAGVEKHPVQGAMPGKIPVKPAEPPKPVVEEVVEKPKVKLRKATSAEALQLIPEATARRFIVLPMGVTDNVLEVAMVNAGDVAIIQILEMQSKMRVKAVSADQKEILDAIDFNYKGFGKISEQISHIETGADAGGGVDLVASTANAPVAAALALIVEEAVKARASDIHIEPEEKRLRIRYRIDGVLHEVMSLPIKIHPPLTSRVKVMSDLNIADHLRPQDGQFSLEVKGKGIDVRVATSPTVHGETVVMRILDKSMAVMELPQLGFSPDCLEKYMKMLSVPFGMICVSGPTGAGKTTTLYASLNTMDKVTRNIITAEDPVEYRFEGIKQIQVNPKSGLTFAAVLRSMMRLDPDVILVGEVRDAETASIAVKAALTGHTVLCSIHANDAVATIYRLLDLGVEPFMAASVITGTIAQRMARRVCTNCAVETKPTEVEAAAYESAMGEKLESFMSGTGCDLCSFSGYKGRLGLYEVLAMTDATRGLILKGATTSDMRNQAIKEGMVTLFKDGMQKVKAGKTTVSEVLRNAYSIE